MTVPSFFIPQTASPSIFIHQDGASSPVLRGTNAAYSPTNGTSSLVVPFPAGSIAGDMAIVAVLQGRRVNIPAGWTLLYQTADLGGVDASCFYKILDATDITTGSVTVTSAGADWIRASIATYQDGADLYPFLYDVQRNTGSPASFTVPIAALGSYSYFVWGGHWGTGAVTFAQATSVESISGTGYSSSLGIYDPSSNASVNETISFASSSQAMSFVIAITKGGTPGKVVTSTAISSAAEGTRWMTGPTYFEMRPLALSGIVGVGLASMAFAHGAAALGTGLMNVVYNSNGQVRFNNTTLTTISPFVQGDLVCVAYNPSLALIWFKVNGGSWNNNGLANPVTLVGGIDITGFMGGQNVPACSFSIAGAAVAGIFAAADFFYTPPSGYNSLEEVVVTSAHNPLARTAPVITEAAVVADCYMCIDPEQSQTAYVSFPAGPVKLIAGEVRENDVGVPNRSVRIYSRQTGDLMGTTRTNSVGEFSIAAKDSGLQHYVVALDDDVDPIYNAKIYDRVIPG